ncbi:hypothetical protein ASF53_06775 [Methylobacterium sp. Leaf123]|uniref:hypothetical protein n=1 Tax=Methylobacterium sp. Leaf123 TaxID=1736264 RepID=UPI0006FB1239|nr:hypothetical protein [Methylobacterium sp. Leaf123]KQQ18062.1 hypothetical protein ASF53_06775 [Methylobacterium sp. Leaf123]
MSTSLPAKEGPPEPVGHRAALWRVEAKEGSAPRAAAACDGSMPETKPAPLPPATEDAGLPTPPSPGRLPPPHLPPSPEDGASDAETDGADTA